jgi:hypothetical protein
MTLQEDARPEPPGSGTAKAPVDVPGNYAGPKVLGRIRQAARAYLDMIDHPVRDRSHRPGSARRSQSSGY